MLKILEKIKNSRRENYIHQMKIIILCLREIKSENWITFEEMKMIAKKKGGNISLLSFDNCMYFLELKSKIRKRFNKEKSRCEYKLNSQI
jgi:hypothetical protein